MFHLGFEINGFSIVEDQKEYNIPIPENRFLLRIWEMEVHLTICLCLATDFESIIYLKIKLCQLFGKFKIKTFDLNYC